MLDLHLQVKTRPFAKEKNIIYWNDYRITVLQSRLFRLEKSENKIFRDKATQTVWFRDMPEQKFSVSKNDEEIIVDSVDCRLIVRKDRDLCRIILDGKEYHIDNSLNLKGTCRTLDCYNGKYLSKVVVNGKEIDPHKKIELGNGVCSKNGIATFNDENSLSLDENGVIVPEIGSGTDEYIFAYGKDYRKAVKAFYMITGNVPLIPRYALGNWWSRYHAYTDWEYLSLLNTFEEKRIPFTVATLDMDWHYSDDEQIDRDFEITQRGMRNEDYLGSGNKGWNTCGWTGYSWNKNLFPNHKSFLEKLKKKGLVVTLNLHPADGIRFWEDCYADMEKAMGRSYDNKCIPFDISDEKFINAYFSVAHKPHEEDGVEFWWIDWQQGTVSAIDGLDPLWALNHYHYLDNGLNHKHPLILSRYSGIGAHRYPLGFSGDTFITWDTLKYLPEFTATASNIGYAWWSHDIGGHMSGKKDNELFVRMIQFGVFSPINRLHCCDYPTLDKVPWVYGNGCGLIAEEWLRLRHRLIPYLYSYAYLMSTEGVALIEPLYYEYKEKEAYKYKNEYIFCKQMIVAPITSKSKNGVSTVTAWIPEGRWTDLFTGDVYVAGVGGFETVLYRDLRSIPVLVKEGAIIPFSLDEGNSISNPHKLEIRVFRGSGEYFLYEDTPVVGDNKWAKTRFNSCFEVFEDKCVQRLEISFNGDSAVIPEDRKIRLIFEDILDGNVKMQINGSGVEVEKIPAQKLTFELDYMPNAVYNITIEYLQRSTMDLLLERARRVMTEAELDNELKFVLWNKLKSAEDETEYLFTVDNANIPRYTKEILKETLMRK